MFKLLKWFKDKKDLVRELTLIQAINDQLRIQLEYQKDKNRKCQESINKTNSYWKGVIRTKKSIRKDP